MTTYEKTLEDLKGFVKFPDKIVEEKDMLGNRIIEYKALQITFVDDIAATITFFVPGGNIAINTLYYDQDKIVETCNAITTFLVDLLRNKTEEPIKGAGNMLHDPSGGDIITEELKRLANAD